MLGRPDASCGDAGCALRSTRSRNAFADDVRHRSAQHGAVTTPPSETGTPNDNVAERTAILTRMLSDQRGGQLRSLDENLAQWPGLEEVVREEFEPLVSDVLHASDDTTSDDGESRYEQVGDIGHGVVYRVRDRKFGSSCVCRRACRRATLRMRSTIVWVKNRNSVGVWRGPVPRSSATLEAAPTRLPARGRREGCRVGGWLSSGMVVGSACRRSGQMCRALLAHDGLPLSSWWRERCRARRSGRTEFVAPSFPGTCA